MRVVSATHGDEGADVVRTRIKRTFRSDRLAGSGISTPIFRPWRTRLRSQRTLFGWIDMARSCCRAGVAEDYARTTRGSPRTTHTAVAGGARARELDCVKAEAAHRRRTRLGERRSRRPATKLRYRSDRRRAAI